MRVAEALDAVMTRVSVALTFLPVITLVGLLRRLLRVDSLRLRFDWLRVR